LSTAALFALSGVAMANMDPSIGVVGGDPPSCNTILVTDINAQVQPTLGSCFIVTNNAGAIIDSLEFDMTIETGLNPATVQSQFTINQGSGVGYFLNETVSYTPANGALGFDFFGVKKSDKDEACPGGDADINEQEGIPAGCVFTINLNGWTSSDPGFYDSRPTFTNSFTTVPEPSTPLTLMIALLGVAGVFEYRRRRTSALSSR
jgi:hypothetical protein